MTDERALSRRGFVASAVAAGIGIATRARPAAGAPLSGAFQPPHAFHLHYAPHFGSFQSHAGDDLVAQLEFARGEGFTAWEDNGMRGRSAAEQDRIGRAMERLGMHMGVFVAHTIGWNQPQLVLDDVSIRDRFLQEVRESIDVARRVNAKWMTVVPGHVDAKLDLGYQTANVIEALKRAAAILEPQGLAMVIEPLNTLHDHPGQFLTRVPQAYMICKAVGSPACKILYDMYHAQITEGNIIPNIDAAWSEIGYFQIGDNPGRKEPGTGEVNYRSVFRHLHARGYAGVLGMEHGNAIPGKEGERALVEAYIAADRWGEHGRGGSARDARAQALAAPRLTPPASGSNAAGW